MDAARPESGSTLPHSKELRSVICVICRHPPNPSPVILHSGLWSLNSALSDPPEAAFLDYLVFFSILTDTNMRRKQPIRRKRTCYFCDRGMTEVDYRDPHLRDFLTEKGKIVSGKMSGVCARHQRRLARAIKTARSMALLPFNP